jgi:DNA-binding transcriptional MerR regulator
LWCHVFVVTDQEPIYGVEELAERAGVSRRTVRYYVQRGLLPAPLGVGRGKHYSEQHLSTLVRIRDQQAEGVSLEDIAARVSGAPASREVFVEPSQREPQQSSWTRIVLFDGVELHLRGRRLAAAQIDRLTKQITRVIEGDEP